MPESNLPDIADLREVNRSTAATTKRNLAYDTGYFSVRPARFPPGTPTDAKHARRYYAKLSDERQFLQHLRKLWVDKLAALKEDRKFLENMKSVTEQDVEGVQPLFQAPQNDGIFEQQTTTPQNAEEPAGRCSNDKENGREDSSVDASEAFEVLPRPVNETELTDPYLLSVLAELDDLYPAAGQTSTTSTATNSVVEIPADSVVDQEKQNPPSSETADEQERNALKLFLEQFGDIQ